jgi:hypothetical protein
MICEFHMIFHGDDYWYIPGSIIKKQPRRLFSRAGESSPFMAARVRLMVI